MTAAPAGPLNPREFLILLSLTDGPQHGYAILKSVEADSGGSIRFDPANLYRTLKRLHRDGLVAEVRSRADDRRRTFALTAEGRRAAQAEAVRVQRLAVTARVKRLVPREGGTR